MADLVETPFLPRVLSGMRPTGKLHLGNYMGALANWVKLQDQGQYECYFFIADWHALTTDYADPSRVKLNTLDVALDWLAAGLDPQKSSIFIQSHVPQHAELHLLFSMITPLGWLERVPTYKEQQENLSGKDLSTYGFLGYPLLQSADILLYQPQYVPVGADQVAHVELTREVARRFNSMYKTQVFPEPDALLTPTAKLPGMDGRKMSKSYGNTLGLTESPVDVAAKIQAMSTNGQRLRKTDAGDPELCPVSDLHKVFSSAETTEFIQKGCRAATNSCEACKAEVSRSVVRLIEPIHARRRDLEREIDRTWEMLREQSARAAVRAEQTMRQVREIFDLSHELGDVRRYFGATENAAAEARSLAAVAGWLELGPSERTRKLRDHWKTNLVPRDVVLSAEANRIFTSLERELEEPFLTAKNKRVFVTAAVDSQSASSWEFEIPVKSYEVWTLLGWQQAEGQLRDFIVPQKFFSQPFAKAKKAAGKDGKVAVRVAKDGANWQMTIAGSEPVDVTQLAGNYEPLG